MFERFTRDARNAVVAAQDAARELGHEWVGCEHLLLGLASQTGTPAADALASLGLGPDRLRAMVVEVVGPCPDQPDSEALGVLGIDLEEVRRRAELAFGKNALERTRAGRRLAGRGGAIPFTARAKKALELALHVALHRGDNGIGGEHVLAGVIGKHPDVGEEPIVRRVVRSGGSVSWDERENLGLVVLARLGISADDVRRALGERLERDAA